MTATQANYREFLKSDFWKEISAAAKARDGKCVRCGALKKLQAHHLRYPEDWFETTLEDLETLCRTCHRSEHGFWTQTEFDRKAREIILCFRYQHRPPKEWWHELKELMRCDGDVMEFGEVMFQFICYQFGHEQEGHVQDWWMDGEKNRKYWQLARRVRASIWERVKGTPIYEMRVNGVFKK